MMDHFNVALLIRPLVGKALDMDNIFSSLEWQIVHLSSEGLSILRPLLLLYVIIQLFIRPFVKQEHFTDAISILYRSFFSE